MLLPFLQNNMQSGATLPPVIPTGANLIIFENNSNGNLATAIDNVTTSITMAAGQGANFPDPAAEEIFFITLQNYTAQLIEICEVTDRSGDFFTVKRGQDGTDALSWSVIGTAIQLRVTKNTLERFVQTGLTLTPGSVLTVDTQGKLIDRVGAGLTEVTYEYYTSAEGQDVFNTVVDLPTTATGIVLFINGVRQFPPTNFTRTGLNQITITETLAAGDQLVIGA